LFVSPVRRKTDRRISLTRVDFCYLIFLSLADSRITAPYAVIPQPDRLQLTPIDPRRPFLKVRQVPQQMAAFVCAAHDPFVQ
jgi:hypothetical protein